MLTIKPLYSWVADPRSSAVTADEAGTAIEVASAVPMAATATARDANFMTPPEQEMELNRLERVSTGE